MENELTIDGLRELTKKLKTNIDVMNDTFGGYGLQFQRLGIQIKDDEGWGCFIIEFSKSGSGLSKDIRVNIILYDDSDNIISSEQSEIVKWKNFGGYGKVEIPFFNGIDIAKKAVSGRVFATGAN